MPIIGNGTWTDAANYGQGLGNSLAQALIQLPQQREEMAARLAQMQQMGGYRNALLQLQQQRANDLGDYRSGMLDWRQNQLDAAQKQNQVLDAIRQMQANTDAAKLGQGRVEGGYYVPGVGQGLGQQPQPDMQQPQAQPQGLPGGIVPLPRQFQPINPNAADRNQLEWLKTLAALQSSTNPALNSLTSMASNRVYNAQSPQQQVQPAQQGLGQSTNAPIKYEDLLRQLGVQ